MICSHVIFYLFLMHRIKYKFGSVTIESNCTDSSRCVYNRNTTWKIQRHFLKKHSKITENMIILKHMRPMQSDISIECI